MSRIVHKLIASTAKEIASEAYEVMCSNDRFYKRWPKRGPFVAKNWHEFIGHARDSLTAMLRHVPGTENNPGGPKYYYTQHVRDEIFEALLIDGANKTPPPLDVHAIRAKAGFDPLASLKRAHGGLLH